MKIVIYLLLVVCGVQFAQAQTLTDAKQFYQTKEYAKALPIIEKEYKKKPADAQLNLMYGVCLLETNGDMRVAEKCLTEAAKKRQHDANLFLGRLYMLQYRFDNAEEAYEKYQSSLKEKDGEAHKVVDDEMKYMQRLRRMFANTEDIQIIDSVVVDKDSFLSAYKLSPSNGKIEYFNQVFTSNKPVNSTVYFNEKETKIYFGQPDTSNVYGLYSMDRLLDKYGNERKLAKDNFGLSGDVNYPFVLTDGVTVYFAACDEMSIGGYDLFVTRYNLNNDSYLTPERLNMPFNSVYNDYMLVVDEEKGVGWFASDRFLDNENEVCIYTFIPNKTVKHVQSDDEQYKIGRALITRVEDSWQDDLNYGEIIALARKEPVVKKKAMRDFEFIVNDKYTYYLLSDFKNISARDTYFEAIQARNELKTLQDDLAKLRDGYVEASAEDKQRTGSVILNLEQRQNRLQQQIPVLEEQARNEEIKALGE